MPVPVTRVLAVVALALALGWGALGCGEGGGAPGAGDRSASASAEPAANPTAEPTTEPAARPTASETPPSRPPRQERPLPAFEGTTLDGEPFAVSQLLGRRAVLFFFNPDVDEAGPAADAVANVARSAAHENFEVVGVAVAAGPERIREFAQQHGLHFRIVADPAARIPAQIGLRTPVAIVGADADGYLIFGVGVPPAGTPDATAVVETQLRTDLRLPSESAAPTPTLGVRPKAPAFSAERLEGGRFELASLRGKPVVLIFFLYTCPHCHHALEFLKEQLAKMPEAARPQVVGVSVAGSPGAVRERLQSDGLDFFPVLLDPDHDLRNLYGVLAGVPDIFVIDSAGRVVTRMQGWRDDRDPVLLRMWLAKVAGQKVPMLLHATGYSGSEVCGICHESEHDTWLLTEHAHAFDTLVRHGSETDPECVSCHVVGYGQSGGYATSPPTPWLENVGCETCHGRGGPHLSPQHVKDGNYEPVCKGCHDAKHSLGFAYASFLPRISHAANQKLVESLSLEERRKLLARRSQVRSDLLPGTAHYVGSEACRSCHAQEYATWAASKHAHAMDPLEAKGEARNATCQSCHVTAFGRPGGFAKGAAPADHPDLARVGCESCHGPGGDHVGPDARRVGTIVSLGDKCDSCVILQICGTCHDDANDPGFEFEVKQKIEAQRHGTIEPAATRGAPKPSGAGATPGPEALRWPTGSDRIGALEHGFALLDARG